MACETVCTGLVSETPLACQLGGGGERGAADVVCH